MTDLEQQMLDFAGKRWNYSGNQAAAIDAEFGIAVTRFWQIVDRLLDDPEAMAYSPVLVKRLQRIRSARKVSRASRR